MLRKIIFILFFMLISGCGGNHPEKVAVKYLELISEGKISKAKEMVSPKNEELKRVVVTCAKEEASKLRKEALRTYKKLFNKRGNFKKNKHIQIYQREMKKLIKQYGSIFSIPDEKKLEVINSIISDATKGDKVQKTMIGLILNRDSKGLAICSVNAVYNKINEVKAHCALGKIKGINVIHLSNSEQGDEATVKLEVIFENGKSNKYNLNLERIQGTWKISGGFALPWLK